MRDLLASEGAFVVRAQLSQVFAGVLGIAREKHLRAALKRLEHDCTTTSNSKGNLYGKRIVPS
jgi:DNA-binding transcriptional regulator PaaX